MGRIAADTTFLIDWQREAGRGGGPVSRFLQAHAQERYFMSVTVLGEFSAGFADLGQAHYRKVREGIGLLPMDEETALTYRNIFRELKSKGGLIGANDLWIAACALRHRMPLVTRNRHEFDRVPGLRVLGY
jgi:predicted nucleic acid-binding protein